MTYSDAKNDTNKRARASLLISLGLHAVMAVIFTFILLEHPREEAAEFMAVDMVQVTRRTLPHRRTHMRESIMDFQKPSDQKSKTQIKPHEMEALNVDFARESASPDAATELPELRTDAKGLKSRFDMPLSRPTGATIMKPGTGSKRSSGSRGGAVSVGLADGAGIFETALYWISRSIVGKNKTGKEDIVFIVDASGTMEDNIAAVARYLNKMIDVFEESDLDYTIGVIQFKRVLKVNDIRVSGQTKELAQVRKILRSIECEGDERALDAIEVGLNQVGFRDLVDKTFVLVTDELLTPRTVTRRARKDVTLKEMLQDDIREMVEMCKNSGVKVSVLGVDDGLHKSLAKETGGIWFQIPQQDGLP
jgi:hypothetical protein